MRNYKNYNDVFKEVDKVFKDVDKVFKNVDKVFNTMEKRMEEVMAGAAESYRAPWEKWFAWRPVTVKGKRAWMKTVYRRRINTYVNYDDWARYEYGDIFDVLKEAGNGTGK